MEKINLCLAADNNYAEHMYITVYSALKNLNQNFKCNVYILDSWLRNDIKIWFQWLEKIFAWNQILFIHVDEEKYKRYPSFQWTYQTYFRLDIPYLLPKLNKVLYLDPDIVVNWDISEFYSLNIYNYAIATPIEHMADFMYKFLFKIPSSDWYFNWGVLLMNLDFFRKNNLVDLEFDYLNNHKEAWSDQEAENAVLCDKRKQVSWIYNATTSNCFWNYFKKDSPIIIHYCRWPKPRKPYCFHPFRKLYHKYRKEIWLKKISHKKNFKLYIITRFELLLSIIWWVFPKLYTYLILFIHIIKNQWLKFWVKKEKT